MTVTATASRKTLETEVVVNLNLDGMGKAVVSTGMALLDHLVSSMAFHAGFDLALSVSSPGFFSAHHAAEDAGIVLGEAFREAAQSSLAGVAPGIARFGDAAVPMDESLVLAAVDIGGRGCFRWDIPVEDRSTDGFECRLAGEFLKAFCSNAKVAVHLKYVWGSDPHHLLEASFKALAVAMREALAPAPNRTGAPSTKGVL
ncbi:MAG: imidazoleglycerol-phosphate dehydratase [Firmicutes bacterium]|nr:imidazoleglycerol-phosphate dehydratase [Bacillota bacterium]